MLHPDKNKSVGADGAFKFISEAWSILSDKARRAAYDEKINAKAQKGSTIFGGSSAKAAANGANHSKKKPPSSSRTQKNMAKEQTSSAANKSKSTFWTTCHRSANVVQQAYHKVKRDREEAQAATKKEEALRRKQNVSKKGYFNPAKRKRGAMEGNGASNLGSGIKKFNSTRNLSPVELQNLLVKKARKEISNKLKEFQSNTVDTSAAKKSGDCFQKEDQKGDISARNSEICTENSIGKSEGVKNSLQASTSFAAPTIDSNCTEILDSMLVDVPDPDFHDFFKDRTERSFGENQVWTAYDGDDGMPRRYAMIHKVISLNPFKLQISWLYPNTNSSEPGHQNWIALGFSKTCGEFRIGKREIYDSINYFSQKVRWIKGNDGAICIYPKKGEVWAIYRNWSPNWNELIADDVRHKYDMVEVLEDFVEEHGVTVIPLVKVAGFKTVFHHHFDDNEIKIIPRKEMLRFSHPVPSYVLTGEEAANAPKGCRVLDPDATPFELLEVIKFTQEENIVDTVDSITKEANCEEVVTDMGQLDGAKEALEKVIHKMEISEEDRGKKICIVDWFSLLSYQNLVLECRGYTFWGSVWNILVAAFGLGTPRKHIVRGAP
ncbi:hypothetical protein TSUD_294370 [Trifolium subterraneum]|uniref:J domain-containing protein n=1 Tax=Trifolium subterraneum TaxID=3900 RepID=A0A2Z6MS06_TRISU|nr:hypothetical protein TSUD_294370 [Trifolium subterraneum]